MDVPEVVPPGLNVRASTVLFVFALLLPIACVSLDKPPQVAKCAAEGNCSDDYVPPDNRDAAVAPPSDARVADEPTGSKEDLGPDSTLLADVAPGRSDVAGGKQDVLGGEAGVSDVLPPADARLPLDHDPPDVRTDAVDAPSGEDAERNDVNKEDVAREDGPKADSVKLDVSGPEAPRDAGTADVPVTACPAVNPVSGGNILFGTKGAICFVTCDVIKYGWGCSSFDDSQRTIKVNGQTVKCSGALPPQKQPGNYYYFEIGAGGNSWDTIHWSGDMIATCPTPSGGFVP